MSAPERDDEFFVGYFPTPKRTLRFSLGAGVIALLLVAGGAVAIAATMGNPGRGVIPFHGPERRVGILQFAPHGILWTIDPRHPERVHAIHLVRGGKHGVPPQAAALDGRVVLVEGGLLDRNGQQMIELLRLPSASTDLAPDLEARIRARAPVALGHVRLRGEIVDSKCWLGRMRPGDGRTHRACAQLCVSGGIPPMLVTRAPDGRETGYLVIGADRRAIHRELVEYLAEPVEIEGELERTGDLLVLRTEPDRVQRL
ncbi:MAG: hypothetical protein IT379_38575 [Deltaproteobacteria bacterium]|nr:hypothetical protein [Deltaproteobacteria bacterium]